MQNSNQNTRGEKKEKKIDGNYMSEGDSGEVVMVTEPTSNLD